MVEVVLFAVAPVKAHPAHALENGVDVLLVLLDRVGVVKAHVAVAAVVLGKPEVEADALDVPDVQIAVGLRREPGVDGHALELTTLGDVLVNEIMDEVLRHGGFQLFWHVNSLLYLDTNSYFTLNSGKKQEREAIPAYFFQKGGENCIKGGVGRGRGPG